MSRLRTTFAVAAVLLAAIAGAPGVAADLAVSQVPSIPEINIGARLTSQASVDASVTVTNNGGPSITIQSISASDPIPGYVVVDYVGSLPLTLNAGQSTTLPFRITATSNQGNSDTTTPSTISVVHDGSPSPLTFNLPLSVRDYREAQLELSSPQSATHTMPCPRDFSAFNSLPLSLRLTNSGDYSFNVQSLTVDFGSAYRTTYLASFPTVNPGSTDYPFSINVPGTTIETTLRGTVRVTARVNTGFTTFTQSASGTFNVVVQHPVDVVMPTQNERHDFGQVELMRPPERPWSFLIEERCGYKDGTVTVDTPPPPGFVLVDPNPLRVPMGGSALLRVIPRFNSSHVGLLHTPQDFQVKFRTNGAANPTYLFQATPSFINVQTMKTRLLELSQDAPTPTSQEVARRTLDLVVNRTEVRRPSTATELEDAGRIVGLAEPVILALEQFQEMERLNAEGRQEQAVQSLSVLAAGLGSLRSVCTGVAFPADRTECLAIVDLLEGTMAAFAEAARRHFEGLTGGGLTELGELRAAESLSLVLEALGDEEGAALFEARAQHRFVNFTARLATADAHIANVQSREDLFTPGGFLETEFGYVAWHPLGLLFLESFEAYAGNEFAKARTELVAAGEGNRVRDLDAEAATVDADLSTGRVLTLAVTTLYALALLLAGIGVSTAWYRRRSDHRLVSRGDVVLGRTPPLV